MAGVMLEQLAEQIKALADNTELSPREIVEKSLQIAGDMCIYTNHNRVIETIE